MLFDLGGKRKRFIQVIYVFLALLMGGGLVLFGIGGSANGGIFDALGIGGSSNGNPTNPDYQKQIDKANESLSSNPTDEKALLILARYEFLTAQNALETDDRGQQVLTADALTNYQSSLDAWQKYLATKPDKPDDNVATLAQRAYEATIDTSSPDVLDQVAKLATTAGIIANARPGFVNYSSYAFYSFLSGNDKTGTTALKKATAAADSTQRKQLEGLEKQAKASRDAIKQSQKGSSTGAPPGQLSDPTGGLGASPGSPLPSGGIPGATAPPASP